MDKQQTIRSAVTLEGAGLHTGEDVKVTLSPADINTGIQFKRVDIEGSQAIRIGQADVRHDNVVTRCTTVGNGSEASIHTVEHLMSVLNGVHITNLLVELNGPELPGLDGSGLKFLDAIEAGGIVEQEADAEIFYVKEPIGIGDQESSLLIVPSDSFRVSYTLDYDHDYLRSQFVTFELSPEEYKTHIAPARTFCLEREAQDLQKAGLGKGANYQNTLVVGSQGVIENKLRFEDEFARHKVLDLIGDLYLGGIQVRGHIYATRSGHKHNISLLRKILEQKKRYDAKGIITGYDIGEKKEITIDEIMKILPHRYPFLLVDKVVEIEKGKKAVGIKNVTINDNFFQGHFPTRPIMPGVLMVEAMAQTGGVVVLTNEAHHGKVAFFMAVDNVKFRKVVSPGDQLLMEVEVVRDKSRAVQLHAVSRVDGEIVAEADMIFSFVDRSFLD